ncbi:MAG: N-formylglutamate amidohydrolase [Rhodospirillaceae bacterium]|nr:N-formylglutamate amidohydrolase [Rhodospirillaceae bacterium]
MTEPNRQVPAPDSALLTPEDPPPFEIVNGSGKAPLLLLCDHASNVVPRALDGLGLSPADLHRHIAWDIGAAEVSRILSARFDAPLALAGYSRLVTDCNRQADDPTFIVEVSEDTVIPGNRGLSAETVAARMDACYWPYHRAVEDLRAEMMARGPAPAVVSVHSFPPVFKARERPWHIGILWNRDPRLAVPLMDELTKNDHVVVGDNKPYSARDEYGYSIQSHGAEHGLPQVLVELRQDLLEDHESLRSWAGILGDALAAVLDDPDLYRVARFEGAAA